MVNESLEKGWRTWSAEAAELQLLRGDRDNQETQGSGFFKMSEEAMAVMQEDLAHDLYELETSHREEITRLMEEFDALDIDTSVKLDDYERKRRQQTTELGPPPTSEPPPPHHGSHEDNQDEEDDVDNDDENDQGQGVEPSLYDILQDDEEEEDDDKVDANDPIDLE